MKCKLKRYAHIYTLFLMLFFCTSGEGQNKPDLPKQNVKPETKDSIISQVPNSMVRNIKQARNGDILIASFLGVFRYDGKSFTNLTGKINTPSFFDVLEDRKGNLWFASRDSGVYCFNGKSVQHFTTKDGLASNMALHLYEDRAGNIWFGTTRYDGESFRNFTTKDGFPSNNVRLLLEDKTGKLWFGGHGENMFVYDARLNGEVGQGKTFTVLKNKDGKAFNSVWSIIEDKKGNIWFAEDGLFRYDGKTFTKVSQTGAYSIIEDKKGNIWTSSGSSIFCYDEQSLFNITPTVKEIKVSGENSFLFGILEANDGSIWVGARGPASKVYRYNGKTITDFKEKDGQK
ncbi:two-component regulator propeller domain-containing protein [uncultured Chitinophaga sp.]|uniref:ligand-binding sensor domain-containing protein n=1 Tax=uncultured Chitinophaga sp. TaxID=339340 RepID=UPI0025FCEA00|nr:two-component regulator propeller domain-containing protein [uncultured Chitinophaga sp.]